MPLVTNDLLPLPTSLEDTTSSFADNMVARYIFPVILTLLPTVTAKRSVAALGESPYSCVEACKDALGLVTFGDTNPLAGYYVAQCTSKLFVTSVAACANAYCSASRIRSGWQYSSNLCREEGKVDLMSFDAALAAVPTDVPTVSTLTADVLTYNETILVDKEAWAAGFHTEVRNPIFPSRSCSDRLSPRPSGCLDL
jgi:hypothetical protein